MSTLQNEDSLLFVGTYGHVIALDKSDGELRWDTSLPKTGFSVVSMLLEDGVLLCASGGRVFGLDPVDGRILWENPLPGRGSGIVALATAAHPSSPVGPLAAQEATTHTNQTAIS